MISPREVVSVFLHPVCRGIAPHVTIKYDNGLVLPLLSKDQRPTKTIVEIYYKNTAVWNAAGNVDIFTTGAQMSEWLYAVMRAVRDIDVGQKLPVLTIIPGKVEAKSDLSATQRVRK